jgi:uncharacterized protein YbjQ (UPF0145 family)
VTDEKPKNGIFTDFFANSQMKSKGNYKDGKKDGKWNTWFKNGNKQCEGEYADGLEVGNWIWWNENSQKIFEGNHKDGIVVLNKLKDDDGMNIFRDFFAGEKAKNIKSIGDTEPDFRYSEADREVDEKRKEEIEKIILTTENNPQDLFVEERIEIITAECVYGMNIFRDLFARARDIVGGRSVASQKILRDARKICLSELKIEAHSLGADAVIGVDLDYSEFSGSGKSMLFIVASGTAVKLKKG